MKEIYEEALFKLRMFEREHNMRCFGDVVPQPYSNRIEELINNYEKVIEILKDRIRPILIPSNDVYILRTNAWSYIIQEQEYDLLKEVLENDK